MESKNELPKRKSPRIAHFDYCRNGAYFITICTHNRENTLASIVGEGSPLPQLTQYGMVADKWVQEIPEKYPDTAVDRYVIMPNHIHIILSVVKKDEAANSDANTSVDKIIGWFKYQTTKEVNAIRGMSGEKLFQRSFYDHVIRNQIDYDEITKYIVENPLRWQFDQLNIDKIENEYQ